MGTETVLTIVIPLIFALGGSQGFLYYKIGRMEQRIINAVNGYHCKKEEDKTEDVPGGE